MAAVLVPVPDPVTEAVAPALPTVAVGSHALRVLKGPYLNGRWAWATSVCGLAVKQTMLTANLGDWTIEHDRD